MELFVGFYLIRRRRSDGGAGEEKIVALFDDLWPLKALLQFLPSYYNGGLWRAPEETSNSLGSLFRADSAYFGASIMPPRQPWWGCISCTTISTNRNQLLCMRVQIWPEKTPWVPGLVGSNIFLLFFVLACCWRSRKSWILTPGALTKLFSPNLPCASFRQSSLSVSWTWMAFIRPQNGFSSTVGTISR